MTDEEIRKILATIIAEPRGGHDISPSATVKYIIPVHYFSIMLFAGESWRSSKPSFFAGRPSQYNEMLVRILCPSNKKDVETSNVDVLKYSAFKDCNWRKYFRMTGACGFNVPMTEIYEIIRYCDQVGQIIAFAE